MSDLADRMQIESDFAAKLSRLSSRQRRELADILGNPPNYANVTPEHWERWERERRDLLILLLLLIAYGSAEQHSKEVIDEHPMIGDIETEAKGHARQWAVRTGIDLARQQIGNIRDAIAQRARDWAELARTGGIDPEIVTHDLVDVFSPRFDANTAASYTTAGNSAGINGTVKAANVAGAPMVLRWFTQADSRVCPTCGPLHRKIVDLWDLVLRGTPGGSRAAASVEQNGGPPAHPNCRCYVELVPRDEPIGALRP